MSEETQSQVDTAEAPQVDAPEPKMFDAEYVKTLRAEAAKYRKEAQAFKAEADQFKTAQMSETERLQKEAADAKAAAAQAAQMLRDARKEAAIARAAVTHGVAPDLLGKLVEVEFDDSGMPVDVDSAVGKVLATYPQLKAAAAVPNPTNPGRKAELTLDDVRKMTPDQINARWDDVQRAMKAGR